MVTLVAQSTTLSLLVPRVDFPGRNNQWLPTSIPGPFSDPSSSGSC